MVMLEGEVDNLCNFLLDRLDVLIPANSIAHTRLGLLILMVDLLHHLFIQLC